MLNQRTRYALRTLIMLAERYEQGRVQIGDIAESQQVPRKFLELILLQLKAAGLVDSLRGRSGGYWLARPPCDISFAEIIRVVEGPLALVPCASLTAYARCGDCHDEATCAIRRAMLKVRDETVRILGDFTLEDAVRGEAHAQAVL